MIHRPTPSAARRAGRSSAKAGVVGLALSALVASSLSVLLPAASATAATPGGAFSSSFETTDPAPLDSTAYDAPVNLTGKKFGPGSLLGAVTNVTASSDNPPSEVAANAADASSSTKWLARTTKPTLTYQLSSAQVVKGYSLTSANDSPTRDPKNWTIEGSQNGTSWTTLDTRTNQAFSARFQTVSYTVANTTAYSYYRLNISSNSGDSLTQLADWEILDGTNGEPAPSPMTVNVGSGPISGPTIKPSVGFTGLKALHYLGSHVGAGEASGTDTVYDGLSIPVGDATQLSYVIFPVLDTSDLQYPATYAAVDLELSDGTTVSRMSQVSGLTDQYGFGVSAKAQGTAKALYGSQWNKVDIDLSGLAGKTITKVLLSYDNPSGTASTTFSGWVDDIKIGDATPIDGSSRTNYVDTRRGTNANSSFSRGNNIPAAAVPNGFNFFTPMTNATSDSWLYDYASANNSANRPTLQGIGISHEPSPWMGDREQLAIMPTLDTATPNGSPTSRALAFSHDNETAQPELYSVAFDNGLTASVTPTDHAGVYRFAFPSSATRGSVILDKTTDGQSSKLTVAADGTVSGWVEGGSGLSAGSSRMFISGRFSQTPVAVGMASSRTTAAFARFDTSTSSTVELRIATSFISQAQAAHNLALEAPDSRTFDDVRAAARALWNDRLGVIDVPDATQNQLVTLYSNLYRLNLYPNSQSENTATADAPVWKYASPVTAKVGSATDTTTNAVVTDGQIYVNNGFWDTYRTVWPLYSLLYPDVAERLVDGITQQFRDGGWIARWTSPGYADLMTGTSSDAAFAQAYVSGALPTDLALEAFDAAVKNATVLPTSSAVGRKGLDTSEFLGYTSTATGESVSWGLEGYINDYAIGQMAKKLIDDPATPADRLPELKDDAAYFAQRSTNYVNSFDPSIDFFQGKNPDGTWSKTAAQYDPTTWGGDYTETDGWNFAFHAPFDVDGLAALYGGLDGLTAKLDQFFSTPETGSFGIHEAKEARDVRIGQWGMSNQVSHHIPWLYAAAGEPSKTQSITRETLQRLFVGSEIGQGYPGDEDNGEMSSWYVFAALGFYPLALGSGQYTIGSPLYDEATVHLPSGDLTITAEGNSTKNVYVQSASIDGQALTSASLPVADLTKQGAKHLDFQMGATASSWGERESTDVGVRTPLKDATRSDRGDVTSDDGADLTALTDDNSRTEVAFDTTTPSIEWTSTSGPVQIASYTLTNGAKAGGDPTAWVLEGSQDGASWTTLDARGGEEFTWRTQTRPFTIANPGLYSRYRLEIASTSDSKAPHIAEWELLDDTTVQSSTLHIDGRHTGAFVGSRFTGSLAAVTGGTKDPSDYSATVDFLDGNGAQKATVTAGDLGGVQITAPHDFPAAGRYQVRVTVAFARGTEVEQVTTLATITVKRDQSLESAFTVGCLTVPGVPTDCDTNGWAIDKTRFTPALTQGATNSVPGTDLTFDLPDIASGQPDNALADGETVRLHVGAGAQQLSVIGFANENRESGTATIHYSDGTTQDITITFGDWVGAASSPVDGNIVVAKSTNRLGTNGSKDSLTTAMFSTAPVTLKTGVTAEYLTLPDLGQSLGEGQLHIFAIASDGTRTATAPFEATATDVDTQIVGTSFTAPLASFTGGDPTAAGYTATVDWGDESGTEDAATSGDATGGTVTGTHTYSATGTYTVTVTVDDGETSQAVTTTVDVEPSSYATSIALSDSEAHPGDTVTVTGQGFAHGEKVAVTLSTNPQVAVEVTADADGAFSADLTVPKKSLDGTYVVQAIGAKSATAATDELVVTIPKAESEVTLAMSATSAAPGAPVTLTATATAGATGAVEFLDGTTSLGFAPLDDDAVATLVVDVLALGSHVLTARYTGDPWFLGSTSDPHTLTIAKAAVTLGAPRISNASVVCGKTSSLQIVSSVVGATSGTVTFRSGTTVLGTASVKAAGTGYEARTMAPATLKVGSYPIVASIAATDATDAATSAAGTRPIVVVKATPGVVTLTGASFAKGTAPKVTITVAKLDNGQYPAGKVTIYQGTKALVTVSLYASSKGLVHATLPKASASLTVHAKFVPTDTQDIASRNSANVFLQVK